MFKIRENKCPIVPNAYLSGTRIKYNIYKRKGLK